jgi:dUTP pyrophosphatase
VAISTMTSRAGSSPVISRSIHTSIGAPYRWGVTTQLEPAPNLRRMSEGLIVPVIRLDPDLPLPEYARAGDAGLDVLAREDAALAPAGGRALVPTGIAFALPAGYAGFVQPRSGLALRHGVTCLNTPGLIDSGYRDELKVLLVNLDPAEPYEITRGERIAQLVVQAVVQVVWEPVAALEGENRGGGFGSTGR